MKIEIKLLTSWELVKRCALTTVNKTSISKINDKWKYKILKAEHSPVRALIFEIDMIDIPYFASVHLTRHKIGVEHFVTTQRTDRTGENRNKKPQDSLVNHKMILNAQALMNIARKRLCFKADAETQKIMRAIVEEMKMIDKALVKFLVPSCVYTNGCNEFKPCGYFKRWQNEKH